jgi:hypothetical protein
MVSSQVYKEAGATRVVPVLKCNIKGIYQLENNTIWKVNKQIAAEYGILQSSKSISN